MRGIIFVVLLCELRRTPFDLVERESELVSRFNTEYERKWFTILFLREYMMLIL